MKKFQKAISVCLVVLMLVSLMPMAALAEYDRGKVSEKNAEYIDSLTDEQMAAIVLDWCDRKVAAATEDLGDFGKEIKKTIDVTSLEGLLGVLQYKDALGGDFANLDVTALNGLSRQNGDLNFIYGILDFAKANADALGKILAWDEEHFDFGTVGEYIKGLDDCPLKSFYEQFLVGTDLQEMIKSGTAEALDYTRQEGDTLDMIINNGVIAVVSDFCKESGLLSETAITELNGYKLTEKDIYTLIKNFVTLIQKDNEVKLNTTLRYTLDNPIRAALKAAFGKAPVIGENDNSADAEFRAAYPDLALLNKLSGGTVCYRANDGKYYQFTVTDSAVTGAKSLTWEDSLLNLEPPVVTITDDGEYKAEYHPTSIDVDAYLPAVYMDAKYADYLKDTAAAEFVSFDAIPANVQEIIVAGGGINMKDAFNIKTTQGDKTVLDMRVTFKELETFANNSLKQALPSMQKAADAAVAAALKAVSLLPWRITGSVTIDSVAVELSYTGYRSDDRFIVEISCTPKIDVSFGGNIWQYASHVGITQESIVKDYITPTVNSFVTNPVATVVVDNLGGDPDGLNDLTAFMNFLDTDFAFDAEVFDIAGNYDEYNGVVGQANHIFCDALDVLLSDTGYASLELTEGGNEYLYDNMQKFCTKTEALISTARQFLSKEDFAEFAEEMNVSGVFASAHGFNAGMVYDTDFSSVENMLVCGVRMLCDFLVKDEEGVLYDIHLIIEDLDTLDAMAVGVANYALYHLNGKLNGKSEGIFDDWSFAYELLTQDDLAEINTTINTVKTKLYARDAIMSDLTDFAYYGMGYLFENVFNEIVNEEIDEHKLGIPHVDFRLEVKKSDAWTNTLNALLDRMIYLLDGITVDADSIPQDATVFGKLGALLKVLPMKTLLSGTTDMDKIAGYIFADAMDGNIEGILSLFEVKEDELAGTVPATKAIVNVAAYVINSVFHDAVNSADYDTLESLTSSDGFANTAAGALRAIGTEKQAYTSAALRLIREANTLLPFFAHCDHTHTETVDGIPSTCKTQGYTEGTRCVECGHVIPGELLPLDPDNHEDLQDVSEYAPTCTQDGHTAGKTCSCGYSTVRTIPSTGHSFTVRVNTVAPTCTEAGYTVYKCEHCDATETRDNVAAKGHHDSDNDGKCDDCGTRTGTPRISIFDTIRNIFKTITDIFRNLFRR